MADVVAAPTEERTVLQIRNWSVIEPGSVHFICVFTRWDIPHLARIVERPVEGHKSRIGVDLTA